MKLNEVIVLFCAFRYALGRRSYVVGGVSEEIIKNWNKLNLGQRKLYIEEIKEAIEKGEAGDFCDIECWRRVLELEERE